MIRIIQGDCREEMAKMEAESVDAIVTDPPYGISFMGRGWDRGVPGIEFWREALRIAKPGAHLLAFGGTRTYHRLTCAIEDAGWEIRDQIGWAFGSGFPKSHNGPWGGTVLKPAWEPIVMARKLLIGTVAENFERFGVGALNIEASRIPTSDIAVPRVDEPSMARSYGEAGVTNFHVKPGTRRSPRSAGSIFYSNGSGMANENNTIAEADPRGRWPANLIHDGSEEVVRLFPAEAGAFAPVRGTEPSKPAKNTYGEYAHGGGAFHNDAGSAARFFYCAKASREDRNEGLDGMATWLSGEQSPGTFQSENTNRQVQNHHPTVKPTDLMRYLCRLVTPKGGTILDPFMGSGSTGRGAIREGFNFIGIEIDADYVEIARKRIHADAPLFAEVS